MNIYEEFSDNHQYKFLVQEGTQGNWTIHLQSYQKEYQDFTNVQGMSQTTTTREEAIKLGRTLLALLA